MQRCCYLQYKFLHFNKTAGTTVQHALRNCVKESQFINIDETYIPDHHGYRALYLKKLFRHGTARLYDREDPVVFSIFRDPAERLYSDFRMMQRWQNNGEIPTEMGSGGEAKPISLEQYVNLSDPAKVWSATNHYAQNILKKEYFAWLGFRQAFHGGDLTPDGVIIDAVLKALDTIDLPFTMNRFSDTKHLSRLVSEGRSSLDFCSMNLNFHNTSQDFHKISAEDRYIIEKNNMIDRIIYDKVNGLASKISYEEEVNRIISEDDSIIIEFDDIIPIDGCYPRECNFPKFSVWTRRGGMKFDFTSRNLRCKRLYFCVSNYRRRSFVDEIAIRVGDHDIPYVIQEADGLIFVDAHISGHIFEQNATQTISIYAPSEPVARDDDDRDLGLEICGLSVVSQAH